MAYRHVEMTLFQNIPWALLGLAIFFGGIIAGWIVRRLILLLLLCGKDQRTSILPTLNHPAHPSNGAGGISSRLWSRIGGSVLGGQPRNTVGHRRKPFHSGVHLVASLLQIVIVTTGIFVAFHVAGVNFFSLAISVGVISMVFTYAGQNLITNTFSGLTLNATDKVEIGDYIELPLYGLKGEVTAKRPMWVEIIDDSQGSDHRKLVDIPNSILLSVPMAHYPAGKPAYDEHKKGDIEDGTAVTAARHLIVPHRGMRTPAHPLIINH